MIFVFILPNCFGCLEKTHSTNPLFCFQHNITLRAIWNDPDETSVICNKPVAANHFLWKWIKKMEKLPPDDALTAEPGWQCTVANYSFYQWFSSLFHLLCTTFTETPKSFSEVHLELNWTSLAWYSLCYFCAFFF